jgi:Arc/MetJ-type ribon-helix-helix transcriptional regulator
LKKSSKSYIFLVYFKVIGDGRAGDCPSARRGKTMEKESISVSIPASLYKKIEEIIKGTEEASVANYIAKVLREKLAQEEKKGEAFSQEDEEKVKERLKALGYID